MKSSDPDCDCLHSYSVSPRWFTFPRRTDNCRISFYYIDENYVCKNEYNVREKYNEKFILCPLWRNKKFDRFDGRRIERLEMKLRFFDIKSARRNWKFCH